MAFLTASVCDDKHLSSVPPPLTALAQLTLRRETRGEERSGEELGGEERSSYKTEMTPV